MIKNLYLDVKNHKSGLNLASMSKTEIIRAIAVASGAKYTETTSGKFFIDFSRKTTPPKKRPKKTTKPVDAVEFLDGYFAERSSHNNDDKYRITGAYKAATLVTGSSSQKLSDNFTLGEFDCHDRVNFPDTRVSPKLVAALEKIRSLAGSPIRILSCYRPPAYNASIGGVSNSAHIDGLAADIYADGLSTLSLAKICDQVIGDSGGVGLYKSQQFVHIDVRGYGAKWEG